MSAALKVSSGSLGMSSWPYLDEVRESIKPDSDHRSLFVFWRYAFHVPSHELHAAGIVPPLPLFPRKGQQR